MTQKVAIIGTGISGLTCAYLLQHQHQITLFEANDYIGGHTRTLDIEDKGESWAVDTGFIVFNDWTYPNFIKLMQQLDVKMQPTEMSFSVKNQATGLEYNGHSINSLFAQRRNLFKPGFYKLLRDIVTFNKACKANLAQQQDNRDMTLGEFVASLGLSQAFSDNYLLPMCAAIWSSSLREVNQFPLTFFLNFFNNHGLLNISNRPQWYTLIGGSSAYIGPITDGFKDKIKLNTPVTKVTALDHGFKLETGDEIHHFDQVIFACHSDQALKMLDQPSSAQQEILSAIPYANNQVVLHKDTSILPKRQLAWASWNYKLSGGTKEQTQPPVVSYNMNILQRLTSTTTFCVTLNDTPSLDKTQIIRELEYSHPQFSQAGIEAQQRRGEICGKNGMHFCGAYWYNGFHEDGVRSALDVCTRFGASL